MILADLTFQNAGPFITVIIGLIVLFGCVSLVLRVANDARTFFGRQPPLDTDVRKIEARVARLEVFMERLATKEALTQLERDFRETLDKQFHALDAKCSRDTAELHKHVESTAANFHKRLNDISAALGDEIKRLPNDIFQMLKNASSFGGKQ
jgi:outer membrane murein-binding lipoprotein Lpp